MNLFKHCTALIYLLLASPDTLARDASSELDERVRTASAQVMQAYAIPGMAIAVEETFGPVLPLLRFKTDDEAIAKAQAEAIIRRLDLVRREELDAAMDVARRAREQAEDLAARVAFETLNDQLESVPRASANKFIQAQRDVLTPRINAGEAKIMPRHAERVAEAQRRLAAETDEELARLTALQAVNPTVRDSELVALRRQREQGLAMLEKAALRLEAIRVLVAG